MGVDDLLDDVEETHKEEQVEDLSDRLGIDDKEELEELDDRISDLWQLLTKFDKKLEKIEARQETHEQLIKEMINNNGEKDDENQSDNDGLEF